MIGKLSGLLFVVFLMSTVYGHDGHDDHLDEDSRSCAAHERSHELMKSDSLYERKFQQQVTHSVKNQNLMKAKRHKLRKEMDKLNVQKAALEKKMAHAKSKGLSDKRFEETYGELQKQLTKLERRRLATANSNSYNVVTIPIVYHVLYTNSNENLSDNQLESQTDVLNKDFRGLNKEIVNDVVDSMWDDRLGDSKLEFSTAQIKRVSISSSSICDSESTLKKSSGGGSDAVDPETYLNIWICPLEGGLLGYAYYPCLLGGSSEWLDGVVVTSSAVGSRDDDDGSFYFSGTSFDLGRTGTHEVGHYLNLAHVWGSGGCSGDDGVDDTPITSSSNYGCPSGTDSCDSTDPLKGYDIRDNYENYMDYTNDACMYMFTDEQVDRMRAVVSSSGCRSTMYNNGNSGTGGDDDDDDDDDDDNDDDSDDDSGEFVCNDGCEIPQDWVGDGTYCDCSGCEDETSWTCSSCGGCPSSCGDYVYCEYTDTNCPDDKFCCDDGCEVSASYENDNYCDCSNCEDEPSWTCSSCSGSCGSYCGDYGYCGNSKEAQELVLKHQEEVADDAKYKCKDGCEIEIDWLDDDYCDCSDCDDESFWTCDNCMSWDDPSGDFEGCWENKGKNKDCDEYRFCDRFICKKKDSNGDTCNVRQVHLNNGWCDCPDCEDEDDMTCDTCGGCPDTCISAGGSGHQCKRTANNNGENGNDDNIVDGTKHVKNKYKELDREYGSSDSSSNNNNDDNGVIIAVAVIASIVGIALIIGLVIFCKKRKNKQVTYNVAAAKVQDEQGDMNYNLMQDQDEPKQTVQ